MYTALKVAALAAPASAALTTSVRDSCATANVETFPGVALTDAGADATCQTIADTSLGATIRADCASSGNKFTIYPIGDVTCSTTALSAVKPNDCLKTNVDGKYLKFTLATGIYGKAELHDDENCDTTTPPKFDMGAAVGPIETDATPPVIKAYAKFGTTIVREATAGPVAGPYATITGNADKVYAFGAEFHKLDCGAWIDTDIPAKFKKCNDDAAACTDEADTAVAVTGVTATCADATDVNADGVRKSLVETTTTGCYKVPTSALYFKAACDDAAGTYTTKTYTDVACSAGEAVALADADAAADDATSVEIGAGADGKYTIKFTCPIKEADIIVAPLTNALATGLTVADVAFTSGECKETTNILNTAAYVTVTCPAAAAVSSAFGMGVSVAAVSAAAFLLA